jgi:hypothetical protein
MQCLNTIQVLREIGIFWSYYHEQNSFAANQLTKTVLQVVNITALREKFERSLVVKHLVVRYYMRRKKCVSAVIYIEIDQCEMESCQDSIDNIFLYFLAFTFALALLFDITTQHKVIL